MTRLGRALRHVGLRIALTVERGLDRLRRSRHADAAPVLDPYAGYAEGEALLLRGRALTRLRRFEAEPGQSRWANLRQMAALFLTDEVAGLRIEADGGSAAVTDEEGYFTLRAPLGHAPTGWTRVPLRIAGRPETVVSAPAFIPRPNPPFLAISDIDDTVLRTGAWSLARNLWTSLTGNAHTREVFEDATALLTACARTGAPVFYVSSSPWNLHAFLNDVLTRAGAPRGPMFLTDYGLSETGFIKQSHAAHKRAAIERLLDAHPGAPALLLGDTGQRDAAIYAEVARRRPGRVRAVALREAGGPLSATDLAALRAAGAQAVSGPTLPAPEALGGLMGVALKEAPTPQASTTAPDIAPTRRGNAAHPTAFVGLNEYGGAP
jgi:phosphatidate phosphatase APP1